MFLLTEKIVVSTVILKFIEFANISIFGFKRRGWSQNNLSTTTQFFKMF